ncbi:MAG: transposase [Planctomycetota bacterium]|nr:transposase [Planctomycetota bacterium]
MARLARVVVPGLPHHITQRGNRRQRTFFIPLDYEIYLDLLAEWSKKTGVEICAYCLMPNHGHLIGIPESKESLRECLSQVHAAYTRMINKRMKWKGYLWQGRFSSFVMDEPHFITAVRYVLQNPVKAGLVKRPSDWPYSSARAHLGLCDDPVVNVDRMAREIDDWEAYLRIPMEEREAKRFEKHARTGRPIGSDAFVTELELQLGRTLLPQKPGPRSPDPFAIEAIRGN